MPHSRVVGGVSAMCLVVLSHHFPLHRYSRVSTPYPGAILFQIFGVNGQ